MFALFRPLYGCGGAGPPEIAPDWTLPQSPSSWSVPGRTLTNWAFQRASSKPRWYDQSCIRLCAMNRFTVAAESSQVAPGAPGVGSQSPFSQSFVHG